MTAFLAGVTGELEKTAGCDTPGKKIRSKGTGRGLAIGKGKGPVGGRGGGRGRGAPLVSECDTPGEKIRSKGKGKGLAIGKGKGPMGMPKKAATAVPRDQPALRGESAKYLSAFRKSTKMGDPKDAAKRLRSNLQVALDKKAGHVSNAIYKKITGKDKKKLFGKGGLIYNTDKKAVDDGSGSSIKDKIEAARRDPSTKANPKDTGPKGSGTQDPRFKAMKKRAAEEAFLAGFSGLEKDAIAGKSLSRIYPKGTEGRDVATTVAKTLRQIRPKTLSRVGLAGARGGGESEMRGGDIPTHAKAALGRVKEQLRREAGTGRMSSGTAKERMKMSTQAVRDLKEGFRKKAEESFFDGFDGVDKEAASVMPGPRGSRERNNFAGMLRSMRGAAKKLRESRKSLQNAGKPGIVARWLHGNK